MSMEIFEGWGDGFFFEDLSAIGSANYSNDSTKWDEREVVIKSAKQVPHAHYLLAMMRAPDQASVSGGYSEEKGTYGEFRVEWDNRSHENSSTHKEKESSSKNEKSSERENSSKEIEKNYYNERHYLSIISNNAKQWFS